MRKGDEPLFYCLLFSFSFISLTSLYFNNKVEILEIKNNELHAQNKELKEYNKDLIKEADYYKNEMLKTDIKWLDKFNYLNSEIEKIKR